MAQDVLQPTYAPDHLLKRHLGFWHLTAAGFSGVIGSGWLVGALYAAQVAGPAAVLTWGIGGIAFLVIALVMADLGSTHPESGALVRWPLHTNGRLAATIVGWGIWIAYCTNPPSESAVVVQYASQHISGIYRNNRLTWAGMLIALALMVVFMMINWYGILLLGRVNGALSLIKWLVPTLTMVVLLATSWHGGNFTDHGGFAPYGYSAALSAISTAGVIYAYTGFQAPLDLSGEARDAHRDVPRAIIVGLLIAMALYIGLQIAFIAAVPGSHLAHGWGGIDFTSPFAQLAVVLNLGWLSWVLYGDAIVSPSGSALVFTAAISREARAMGKNESIPRWFAAIHPGSGVPRRALLLNFVLGAAFLLLLPSWHDIIKATSELGLFVYSITMVCQAALRIAEPSRSAVWFRGTSVLAPIGFVLATLILYWAKWTNLRIALPLLAVAVAVYLWNTRSNRHTPGQVRVDVRAGAWLVVYVCAVLLMSWLGSFGGRDWIAQPWDSVVVGVIGAGGYMWGVAEAVRFLRSHPADYWQQPSDLDATEPGADSGIAPDPTEPV
ncbi:MAG TPA: APC family permease [Actinocrinis sp.]|uniref:APC family permease n=1 Tax=Actinocrinis sp. TaxID=1920516 RepID=UPI002D39FA9F|nr:APC family permease [Actinocrinis sp.]HZU56446.1 APC family permease [Actinocrinis sp.]